MHPNGPRLKPGTWPAGWVASQVVFPEVILGHVTAPAVPVALCEALGGPVRADACFSAFPSCQARDEGPWWPGDRPPHAPKGQAGQQPPTAFPLALDKLLDPPGGPETGVKPKKEEMRAHAGSPKVLSLPPVR